MKKITTLLLLICNISIVYCQTECPATMTDVDGNAYRTVLIGKQCWMAENMRSTQDAKGNEIMLGSAKHANTPFRYEPNGKSKNVVMYGYLYNWEAAKIVCPNVWHLPSDAEWTQLTDFVSSQAQYCCGGDVANNAKALSATTTWKKCSKECTVGNNLADNNATGFSALPAGGFYNDSYGYFGKGTFFWSSTEMDAEKAYKRYIDYDVVSMTRYNYYKFGAGAVRCVKN